MRVMVVKPQGGAFLYIARGFINSFNDSGMEAKFWDGDDNSFYEFNPDLYIGCSGHRQQVPPNWNGKKAIHVNPFGKRLEPMFGVDINETRDAINWTLNQNPDVVFGYGLDSDSSTYWNSWTKYVPFVGCPTAGDVTEYYPDKIEVDYKVAFLGGRWGYKGNNINKWLVPVIDKMGDKISIKGWGGWQGVKQYSGVLPDDDSGRQFLSSALVCPCICEPHTTIYGIDIPERFFKVALCGSLPIIDVVSGFDRYCNDYVMASNVDEYYNLILNYSCNPDYIYEGRNIANKIRNEVLNKHTYHHRMRSICYNIGFSDAVKKFDDRISRFTNS